LAWVVMPFWLRRLIWVLRMLATLEVVFVFENLFGYSAPAAVFFEAGWERLNFLGRIDVLGVAGKQEVLCRTFQSRSIQSIELAKQCHIIQERLQLS
jgi:hypothetical protein